MTAPLRTDRRYDVAQPFGGDFKMYVYANRVEYAEHVALVMGDVVSRGGPVMVRMHALKYSRRCARVSRPRER